MSRYTVKNALPQAGARWAEAMQGQGQAWFFIAKTLLAFYLAGWISMRLEMPSPFTTMVTVLVVATPQPGGVLSKGFYRAAGTLIGCLIGLLLISLFPQQPVLLMLAMSIWVALMAAGSLLNRGFRAYSFVLSGYGVSMIVLPSLNQPHGVFDAALWRLAEVSLAVIVTCCVFDVLLPKRLRTPVLATTRQNANNLLQWIVHSSRAERASSSQQQGLVRAAVAYEDLRSLAYFDDPALRRSHGLLGQLNQRYMSVISAYDSLLQLRTRLQRQQHTASLARINQALSALSDRLEPALAAADPAHLYSLMQAWQAQLPALSDGLTAVDELALGRIHHFAEALLSYWQRYQPLNIDKAHRTPKSERQRSLFLRAADPLAVTLAMLRAGLLTFAIGLLWMLSGWQPGASGLFMLIALLSIMAAAPYPLAAFRLIAIAQLFAPILGLLCYSVLPLMNEFIWLVLATLPCMLVMLYLLTRPKWSAAAMCMNMSFMVVLMIAPAPHIDPQWFVNDLVAVGLGILLVGFSFVVIPTVTHSRGQRRRLLAMLRGQVSKAARWPLKQAAERLSSQQYDLLSQLFNMTRAESPAARRLLQWAQLTHEASSALLSLRQALAQQSSDARLRQPLQTLSQRLAELYQKPSAARWQAASAALEQALTLSTEAYWRQPLLQLSGILHDGANVLARHAPSTTQRPA